MYTEFIAFAHNYIGNWTTAVPCIKAHVIAFYANDSYYSCTSIIMHSYRAMKGMRDASKIGMIGTA